MRIIVSHMVLNKSIRNLSISASAKTYALLLSCPTLRMSVRLFACSIHLLARLYFLYSARSTLDRCISNYVLSFLSAALAQTLLFYLCLYFLFVFLFIFILFLRTGSTSLPLRHVCASVRSKPPRLGL